jgi:hypothetical protein
MHLDSSYLLLFLSDAAANPFDSPLNSTQPKGHIEACGIELRESALNGNVTRWTGRAFCLKFVTEE